MPIKLTLRTVSGASQVQEVEVTDTVSKLKENLSSEYDVKSLRVCHKGKVLEDAKTFEELGLADGTILIIAGKKASIAKPPAPAPEAPKPAEEKKEEAKPAEAAPETTTTTAPVPASTEGTTTSAPAPAETAPAPAPAAAAAAPASTAQGGLGADESQVAMLMDMGFPDKEQCTLALRAAFGNTERAVEYLCTGIPPAIVQQLAQQQQQGAPPAGGPPGGVPTANVPASAGSSPQQGGAGMTAEGLTNMMSQMQGAPASGGSALRTALEGIPQFAQIRQVVQSQPSALPAVMQQLQQHHPEVFELVQANPQEFLDLMNSNAAPAPGAAPQQVAGPGGEQRLQLTPEDTPAIERLVALGGGMWDQRAAAIVYLVCQRQEEVAANVLFDNGGLPAELAAAVMDAGAEGGEDGAGDGGADGSA